MKTTILACFPGVGKTWVAEHAEEFGVSILDLDSALFNWESESVRSKDFPQNYINSIKDAIGNVDVLLISTHKTVRDALIKEGIKFTVIIPRIKDKNLYLNRYRGRGNDESYVETLSHNWKAWLKEIEISSYVNGRRNYDCIILRTYLSDILASCLE